MKPINRQLDMDIKNKISKITENQIWMEIYDPVFRHLEGRIWIKLRDVLCSSENVYSQGRYFYGREK